MQELSKKIKEYLKEESYNGACYYIKVGDEEITDSFGYSAPGFPEHNFPLNENSIFDLASVTKSFTTLATLILIDAKELKLSDNVQKFIPELSRDDVTVFNLLTHTSVFDIYLSTLREKINVNGVIDKEIFKFNILKAGKILDQNYFYQCPNMIILGWIVEKITGMSLDIFMYDQIFKPLNMVDTSFGVTGEKLNRTVISEIDSSRGVIKGVVHDPNSYILGSNAGNAGIFSTINDLKKFLEMWENLGSYNNKQIISEELAFDAMTVQKFGGQLLNQGLGWKIGTPMISIPIILEGAAMHGGFTGNYILLDRKTNTQLIFLSNLIFGEGAGERRKKRWEVMRKLVGQLVC